MASTYRSAEGAERVRAWSRAALADWQVPHEDHELDTSLGGTHVVSAGAGQDVCIFLPGTNFTAATSTALLEALSTRFRLYAADLPGQPGLSDGARPRDEVPGYAGWLSELVAWTRGRHPDARIVVAGHSRGAAVALSADPAAVHGLALLSPAGLLSVRPTMRMLAATMPWLVRRNDAGSAKLLRYMSGPGHEPPKRLVEWMTLVARECRTTGAPSAYPDEVLARWRDRNMRVAVGEHDVFFPVDRLRTAARTKLGADVVVVDGAGHLVGDEDPERVARTVAELF